MNSKTLFHPAQTPSPSNPNQGKITPCHHHVHTHSSSINKNEHRKTHSHPQTNHINQTKPRIYRETGFWITYRVQQNQRQKQYNTIVHTDGNIGVFSSLLPIFNNKMNVGATFYKTNVDKVSRSCPHDRLSKSLCACHLQ